MLLFLAAAVLGNAQPAAAERPVMVRQARATVVILRPAHVGANLPAPEDSVTRVSSVRERDGTQRALQLVEFF